MNIDAIIMKDKSAKIKYIQILIMKKKENKIRLIKK